MSNKKTYFFKDVFLFFIFQFPNQILFPIDPEEYSPSNDYDSMRRGQDSNLQALAGARFPIVFLTIRSTPPLFFI